MLDWSREGILAGSIDGMSLVELDPETGSRRPFVADGPAYSGMRSPDGNRVAVQQPDGVWLYTDGRRGMQLFASNGDIRFLRWSTDGHTCYLVTSDVVLAIDAATGAETIALQSPRDAIVVGARADRWLAIRYGTSYTLWAAASGVPIAMPGHVIDMRPQRLPINPAATNLAFDAFGDDGRPSGWTVAKTPGCKLGHDASTLELHGGVCVIRQRIDAARYRGSRVWFNMHVRLDGDVAGLGVSPMVEGEVLEGSVQNVWTRGESQLTVVQDIRPDADAIELVISARNGTARVDQVTLSVVPRS
jgi:hypothetical protein